MENEFLFERLEVYKKAMALSTELTKIASEFPIKFSRIRDQLIGAIVSVPLNIAEGSARFSQRDRNNFFRTARASVFECVPIFEICLQLGLLDNSAVLRYRRECITLSKMLSGLIKK